MLRKQMVVDCVLNYIRIFHSSFFTLFKVPAELDYSILPATHSETRAKKGDGASPHFAKSFWLRQCSMMVLDGSVKLVCMSECPL